MSMWRVQVSKDRGQIMVTRISADPNTLFAALEANADWAHVTDVQAYDVDEAWEKATEITGKEPPFRIPSEAS